jgi:hypothetical protein
VRPLPSKPLALPLWELGNPRRGYTPFLLLFARFTPTSVHVNRGKGPKTRCASCSMWTTGTLLRNAGVVAVVASTLLHRPMVPRVGLQTDQSTRAPVDSTGLACTASCSTVRGVVGQPTSLTRRRGDMHKRGRGAIYSCSSGKSTPRAVERTTWLGRRPTATVSRNFGWLKTRWAGGFPGFLWWVFSVFLDAG